MRNTGQFYEQWYRGGVVEGHWDVIYYRENFFIGIPDEERQKLIDNLPALGAKRVPLYADDDYVSIHLLNKDLVIQRKVEYSLSGYNLILLSESEKGLIHLIKQLSLPQLIGLKKMSLDEYTERDLAGRDKQLIASLKKP